MPSGKPGTRKPKPPDLRETPAKGKPLDGSTNPGGSPKIRTEDKISAIADRMLAWAISEPRSFYIAQFIEVEAISGTLIHKQRISEWENEHPKFAEVYKTTRCILEAHIGTCGMNGTVPPAMSVFGLKQHGHTDKQEIEHSGEIKSTVVQVELPKKK